MRQLLILVAMATAVFAQGQISNQINHNIHLTKTEHFDFQPGGTLRMKNSTGVLDVEGWDRPEVEITVIRSSFVDIPEKDRDKELALLNRVDVKTEHTGNELVVTTTFPAAKFPIPDFAYGENKFALEYHIRAPFNTHLVADHDIGEINVDNLTADIDATLVEGNILLRLPEHAVYAIHAKSDLGSITSDYPGAEKKRPWPFGHRVTANPTGSPHNLNLKVGFGDIIVLKTTIPQEPAALASAQ